MHVRFLQFLLLVSTLPALAQGGSTTDAGTREFGLAPVRTWGSVSYDFRLERVAEQPQRLQQLVTTRLNFSSYFWEPWLAVASGGLGVSLSDLKDSDAAGRDRFLTGNARLNVFPRSRFPLEAHFDATDSRIDSGVGATTSYRATDFGIVQRYRPLRGSAQFMASFDHRSQDSSLTGRDRQDLLRLDFSQTVGRQNFAISSSLADNERIESGDSTRYQTLVARHSFARSSTLTVDTVANWVETRRDLVALDEQSRFLQLSSVAFWRDARRPLTVTASARLFDYDNGREAVGSTGTRQIGANVGATYLLGSKWRLTAGGNLARTESAGEEIMTATETVGASFQSQPIELGPFDYDWFGGADLSASQSDAAVDITTAGVEPTAFVTSLQLGHTLGHTRALGRRGRLAFSLGQNATLQDGLERNASIAAERRITHTASATWNRNSGPQSTFVRLSATDTRALDDTESLLQLINLQATRTAAGTDHSSWSGSLTVQSSRQRSAIRGIAARERGFVTTASADLTYQRNRLFGVPQLRFFSQLRISQEQAVQVFPDPRDRESHSWENRLEYQIGRLAARASVRVARIDEQMRVLATFKVVREIGD